MRSKLLALAIGAGLVASAQAAVFFSETFESYGLGRLSGQGAWLTHSGDPNVAPINVISDNGPTFGGVKAILGSHGSGSREDVNRALGVTMGPGEKFYSAFDIKIEGPLGGADYLAHFRNDATFFAAKFGTEPSTNGFKFTLTQSGSTPTARTAGEFALGKWYRVVTAYTYDSGLSEVWVDQATEGAPDISDTWIAATAVTNYAFRQGNVGTTSFTVDNLITGTSYREVVPEPGSLLLFALGTFLVRRYNR